MEILSNAGTMGVIVIAVVLLFREVQSARKAMGNGNGALGEMCGRADCARRKSIQEEVAKVRLRVDELHRWHAVEDEDGVKRFIVRESLVRSVRNIEAMMERLEARLEKE